MADGLDVHIDAAVAFFNTTSTCQATPIFNDQDIPSGTYQASETITSNGIVPSGNTVTFDAGNSMLALFGLNETAFPRWFLLLPLVS